MSKMDMGGGGGDTKTYKMDTKRKLQFSKDKHFTLQCKTGGHPTMLVKLHYKIYLYLSLNFIG